MRNRLVGIVFLSIFVKGISAILEIGIQMLITNNVGISGYGNYTFFVSIIEFAYYFLFSGSVKLNTYYLSASQTGISAFKRKYNLRFVIPVIIVFFLGFIIVGNPYGCIAMVILYIYYLAYDRSSVLLARGKQVTALTGEYLVGRIIMFIGLVIFLKLNKVNGLILLILYGMQFVTMLIYLLCNSKSDTDITEEADVSLRKMGEYQKSDVAFALISYSPAIMQYLLGSAFSAGFVGIITIIKKTTNFISGPTAKVFAPEFSRLYKENKKEQLQLSYLLIVRVQMIFISVLGTILIGFPRIVLSLFHSELLAYDTIFSVSAACLLLIAGIGPATNLLQMTGNEKTCNRIQWLSIGFMIIICLIMNKAPLFAVYGLAIQAVSEGVLKYYSVCKWFGKSIIPIRSYLQMWLPVAFVKIVVIMFDLQESLVTMIISLICIGLWNAWIVFHKAKG